MVFVFSKNNRDTFGSKMVFKETHRECPDVSLLQKPAKAVLFCSVISMKVKRIRRSGISGSFLGVVGCAKSSEANIIKGVNKPSKKPWQKTTSWAGEVLFVIVFGATRRMNKPDVSCFAAFGTCRQLEHKTGESFTLVEIHADCVLLRELKEGF